jgi:hypothetical protein
MSKHVPPSEILSERDQRFLESYGLAGDTRIAFFTRQPALLALYMVMSLGAYALYWFYRNWDAVRVASGRKMLPLVRAIFGIFYAWPLFKIMILQARVRGYTKPYSGGGLALLYIVPPLVAGFSPHAAKYDNVFLQHEIIVSIVSVAALLLVQDALMWNNIAKREEPYNSVARGEIWCIALLCVLPVLLSIFSKS